jgi:hypothetical protein
MKKYAKVEGHNNLVRDLETNAILNTDSIGVNNYDNNKNIRKSQKKEIESLKNEVSEIKSSIEDIKNLLKKFYNEP